MKRERLNVMTPNPTRFETYSLLLRRLTPKRAHARLRTMLGQMGILTPDAQDHHSAAPRLLHYRDQYNSLYDALLAVLGERLNNRIWTFDANFDAMGAEVWRWSGNNLELKEGTWS